jgi:hypothetical protein
MQDAKTVARIRRKYRALGPDLDDRRRRQWAAMGAHDLGWRGVTLVAQLGTALESFGLEQGTRATATASPAWACRRSCSQGGTRLPHSKEAKAVRPQT